jgi:hypothetical protein
MDDRRLLQRCERRLLDLELPTPFTARAFCEALELRRGRPIRLSPVVGKAGPCGFWVATNTADHIFFEQETSPLHQEHIILHEVGHLLCNHRSASVSDQEWAGLLLPDLDPDMVKGVLRRMSYSRAEEREAELLASLILERAARAVAPRAGRGQDPEVAALLQRLEAAFEQPPKGWHG